MTRPARARPWILPLLVVAATACSIVQPTGPGRPTPPGSSDPSASHIAARRVAEADALARAGQARTALSAYERVLREHRADPAAATALYRLGRLQADPEGGVRNYRAALRAFSRLLADYPQSHWDADARAWSAVLAALIAQEEEAARLKAQIERLRRTDLDLERRR